MNRKYNDDVIYLCKLPAKQLLEKAYGKIVNDDVVLTLEREKHIKERRNQDFSFIQYYMIDTIKDYDYILYSKDNCVMFIKTYMDKGNNILIKLSLKEVVNANSVITGIRINKKTLKRLIKKNRIIDKKRKIKY